VHHSGLAADPLLNGVQNNRARGSSHLRLYLVRTFALPQALDEAVDGADAECRLRALVGKLEGSFPSAAACLADDLPALCVHLRFAPRVRKRLRSSNLLERSLEEVRRRTKVIGRFPGETSCLSLCWAVLDLVAGGARGLGLTDLE